MAQGVNISNEKVYVLTDGNLGVDISNEKVYVLTDGNLGVDVSKINVYVVYVVPNTSQPIMQAIT